jgi:hypothetical protein
MIVDPATDVAFPRRIDALKTAFAAGFRASFDGRSNGSPVSELVGGGSRTGLDRTVANARRSAVRVLKAQRISRADDE